MANTIRRPHRCLFATAPIYFAVASVLLLPDLGRADGGAVQAMRRLGSFRVTAFTSPTPLQAGPVDISVFVQDAETSAAHPEIGARITARFAADPSTKRTGTATSEAATNKLFRAVQLDLDVPGQWSITVELTEASNEKMQFDVLIGQSAPAWSSLAAWIGWPFLVVGLFIVQQWRVGKRQLTRPLHGLK